MNLRTYPVKIRVKPRDPKDKDKYASKPLQSVVMMEGTDSNNAEVKTITFIESYLRRFDFIDVVQVKAGKRQRRIFPNGTIRVNNLKPQPKSLSEVFGEVT